MAEPSVEQRSRRRERRMAIAVALNGTIVVIQVAFGLAADSLGLLSDAAHNLTDVAALILALIAVRMARRPPTGARSFGWHRGTVLAAQANSALILAMTLWIAVESVQRLLDPRAVDGGIVLIVAAAGFVVNTLAAVIVAERGSHDLNTRAAVLHLASDAAASLGVAAAGAVMLATGGWSWLDPAASLAIAVSIGWHGWKLLSASNAVLLEGTPPGLDTADLASDIVDIEGVEAVHDLHVWSISGELRALSAHVVLAGHPSLKEAQVVGGVIKQRLAEQFAIAHATLELECEPCEAPDPQCDMASLAPAVAAGHTHRH